MGRSDDHSITRKELLKIFAAILGVGLSGRTSSLLAEPRESGVKKNSEYRVLGRTGIEVVAVGFGATRTMEPSLVKRALDVGINFLDTGRHYHGGQNEVMVGRVTKGIRQNVIIQSKMRLGYMMWGGGPQTPEARKKLHARMETSLNKSLRALQTDYIDIMLIHNATETDTINNETVLDFLRKAKEEGKIRACGFSSHGNQLEIVRDANRSGSYDVIMVPYNHKGSYIHSGWGFARKWDQKAMEAELKKAEKNGIGVVAMKTCSGGPYSIDGESTPTFKDALKWILSHSHISTMAVAMGNVGEIKEDVQAMAG
jgi:predicted aldo/keto reductase-like oxidoreductase